MTAHWEFAWGPDHLRDLAARLRPSAAGHQLLRQGQRPARLPAHTILERGGLRIGVVGIAATIVDKTMPPHFSEGLRFTLGEDELPRHIAASASAGRGRSSSCCPISGFRRT